MTSNTENGKPMLGLGRTTEIGQLNTFVGVFTPTILTIMGVIMYLRFGWIVGQVGLFQSIIIVVLANFISLAISFSLSAVATNTRVGVGGAYFIVSRSLGLEVGGAIGLPLFLAHALSVTLYAFGLAESLRFVLPNLPLIPVTFCIIIVVALLALRGADIALKAQLPVMVMIALSLLALDRLVPHRLAKSGKTGRQPLGSLALTVALSLAAVFLGDLNTVATVVTIFFLSVYGVINLVAALERLSGNPSWRPTLNVHWGVSLLGACGSFGMMFLIHWPSTVFALSTELRNGDEITSTSRRTVLGQVCLI